MRFDRRKWTASYMQEKYRSLVSKEHILETRKKLQFRTDNCNPYTLKVNLWGGFFFYLRVFLCKLRVNFHCSELFEIVCRLFFFTFWTRNFPEIPIRLQNTCLEIKIWWINFERAKQRGLYVAQAKVSYLLRLFSMLELKFFRTFL